MTSRSFTKRPRVLTLIALGWLAIWPLVAGCQSGAQQDLIARELRMHEDQIYAMEDYITQYQQLVCKYRSENAALRRRLADEYYDEGELPAPRQTPRTDGSRTTPPGGTSIEIRETPGKEGAQPPSREIEIELPEVPPLESSTLDESTSREIVRAAHLQTENTGYGEAALAAGRSRVNPTAKSPGLARAQKFIDQPKTSLRLHGEVVPRDPAAGPRLVVNVGCADDLAAADTFDGDVSLMLLAPGRARGQQSLARWDFGAEDVQVATQDADDERTMRFYLELPADTPIDQSTELWVRLVPHEGEKLLAHANVDLGLPGRFASSAGAAFSERRANELAAGTLSDSSAVSIPSSATASILESDWSIARPGEPVNLPSAEEIATGGWQTSSEPIAVVAQTNAVGKSQPTVNQQAHYVEDRTENTPRPVYKPPTWSPQRPHDLAAKSAGTSSIDSSQSKRPAWAASR